MVSPWVVVVANSGVVVSLVVFITIFATTMANRAG